MHGKPGSYVRRLGVLPVVVCFLMCCIGIQGSDVWPLVLTGNLVPGTADYRFTSFSTASVNSSGTIAFHAGFTTPEKVVGDGVFKIENGELIPIILSGQPVPDSPGAFFGSTGDAAINSRGEVVFIARTTGVAKTIFVKSGGELRRVADLDTPVPGIRIPGEQSARFLDFFSPRINDQGDVAFGADFTYGPGIFLYTQVGLIVVTPQAADRNDFSLNNRGEVVFLQAGSPGVSLFSQGQSHLEVPLPQSVSGVSVTAARNLSLNDDGDIAFTAVSSSVGFRGAIFTSFPAIVRWHNGVLEKIAASGDDVPRFTGSKFTANFRAAGISRSAVLFSASTSGGAGAVVGRFEGGEITTLASDRDFVDGIGTLDFVGAPAFDLHDGKPATFLANAAMSTSIGIFAAEVDPKYTLRFPHIADGGGNSGSGWSTKFVFGNRSADVANTTVSFYDDLGAPLYLKVGGQQVSQISLVVPARGVASLQTEGGTQLKTGWAIAETDASLSGIAIFGLLDGGRAISEVGSPASLPLRSFSVFVQSGGGTSTGVALANPNSVGSNITLILRDANSIEVARTSLELPPMGHLGRYVNELFSGAPLSQFEGKVEVVSSQALAGLTLRQHELAFTSLPVIP